MGTVFKKISKLRREKIILAILIIFVLLFFIFAAHYSGIPRYKVVKNSLGNPILVQRPNVLKNSPNCIKARQWLSQRWSANESDIYLIINNKDTSVETCAFLDIQTLMSGVVLVLANDSSGSARMNEYKRSGTPYSGNMFATHEFKPISEKDKALAKNFYSKIHFWRENLLGELAIITGIIWSDGPEESGNILACQTSQVVIPFERSTPKPWRTSLLPLGQITQ